VATTLGGGEPEPAPADGEPPEELLPDVPDDDPAAGWSGAAAAPPGVVAPGVDVDPPGVA
jgi:hypothetical protein